MQGAAGGHGDPTGPAPGVGDLLSLVGKPGRAKAVREQGGRGLGVKTRNRRCKNCAWPVVSFEYLFFPDFSFLFFLSYFSESCRLFSA